MASKIHVRETAVQVVFDETIANNHSVKAIIFRDPKAGHPLFFSCETMSADNIAMLLNAIGERDAQGNALDDENEK